MATDTETPISEHEENLDNYNDEVEQDDNVRANKMEIHRNIEKNRRQTERKHFCELSSLVTHWSPSKSSKYTQLVLLQISTDLLNAINLRDQYNSLLPSYLTESEIKFLHLEASNAFLFVTTIDSTLFHIKHVTNSIHRILYFKPEQWLEQNFFSFIHPDDLFQVQSQLISLTKQIHKKISINCRLIQNNNSYVSVIIDGIIKKVNKLLKPVSKDECGFLAFIGICYLPLTSEYNKKNMCRYKNPQSLIFSCRCTPNDWKIFLVDCSISTFPSISFDLFRNKSILDFISIDEQSYVHQTLLNSILTSSNELITCTFIYSPNEIFTMILDIKPILNPSTKKIDFIELTFKNITDLIKNSNEMEIY
ncbi:unnamed protein product [Rotaria sp. Silwood2]|nr:unnamed protein product [Rotaria sp. Silwood2]CAF4016823.1 unnamed protein product [Rotaria sp. Silwood2]